MPTPRRTVRFVVETDDVGLPGRVAKQLPRGSRLTILSASVRPDRSEAGALGTIPHAAREADPAPSFTGRQREIAELLVRDMSNKEIGRILGLSHFTVRNHVSQLFRILGIGARREVAGRIAEVVAGVAGQRAAGSGSRHGLGRKASNRERAGDARGGRHLHRSRESQGGLWRLRGCRASHS
ncbi:MAG: helix-turn-helix transcriptional regulator [Sphingopyxis sp.]|nr:helix-turn-helix transcriptional regulator [Sphingopyxis sp.]